MFGLSRGDTVVLPAIAAVVSDIVRDFLSLASALEHQEVSTTQVTDSSIKDELTRFKVCVGNLAAQRPVHRSLEYRLRDAPDLKGDVHNLLRALSETIQNMSAILRGERVPWDAYELSSSGSESESSEDDLQDSTELHQLLSSCHSTITSLFRLSIAIRDPAPAPYYTMTIGAEKSFHERYDTLHVQEKYPDCPVYLAKRLGRGISSRRQYLSYREEHRLNLLESIEKLGLESIGTEHTKNSTEVTSASVSYKQNTVEGLSDEDFASQTSFAASVNASIRVPPLPKDAQTEDFFECPLCFIAISLHTEAAWKKHVFEDLHPYCCTFEECTTADRLYDHRRNWFNHELTVHRGSWQCVEGCGFIFTTEHEFESHVRTLHPELTSVLPAVRRTSLKRPSMSEKVTCLLCTASITIGSLQKHLGSHQQTLTLFALPININEGSDSHEDYERSRGSPEIFRDMNDDTSGSNTPPELVEDSTSRDVSSTYETTLPRASRDLKKDLGQDNLGNAELSNVPMPGDYMESADDGSFGTHSRDNDITFSSLFRKPPTDNVATEKFATIGDKDLRGDTTPSTAEVGSSDNSKEVQIMSKSHLATINSQPLTQSADKQVLFARLGLNEQVHKLLVQDAQMARDRLSADASNLTDQSRLSPYITAPYRWDEISETAKHRILSEVVGNASPDVKHYYTLGSYRNVVNEENWVARWYLWHSFRCRDNR